MYYQQVSVDLFNMVYTAIAYLGLAAAVWLFLRLIQACFNLPNHMKRQNDIQTMLQQKVESYERYLKECEEKEAAGEVTDEGSELSLEEKRKERQSCLNMMKHELDRIRSGGDPYDLDYLFAADKEKLLKELEEDGETEDGEKSIEQEEADGSCEDFAPESEPKKDK